MTSNRNPPETPEGVAWELFLEIRSVEEKAGRRSNQPLRAEMLDLFHQCLIAARGGRELGDWRH